MSPSHTSPESRRGATLSVSSSRRTKLLLSKTRHLKQDMIPSLAFSRVSPGFPLPLFLCCWSAWSYSDVIIP